MAAPQGGGQPISEFALAGFVLTLILILLMEMPNWVINFSISMNITLGVVLICLESCEKSFVVVTSLTLRIVISLSLHASQLFTLFYFVKRSFTCYALIRAGFASLTRRTTWKLTLSLFMFWVFTNNCDSTFSFNTFAFVTNFLYWTSNFHCSTFLYSCVILIWM